MASFMCRVRLAICPGRRAQRNLQSSLFTDYDLCIRLACRHSRLGEGLAVLNLLKTVLLEADGVDLNETGGVHGGEALEGVHGGIGLGVKVAGIGLAAEDVGVTLVGHHADLTSNVLLGEDDGVLDAVGG